jgi:hypothetical protein
MKITDFGLWFWSYDDEKWSTTLPISKPFCDIYYNSCLLGLMSNYGFSLSIWDGEPLIINLKIETLRSLNGIYTVNRHLTLDDFEVIPNPDYQYY